MVKLEPKRKARAQGGAGERPTSAAFAPVSSDAQVCGWRASAAGSSLGRSWPAFVPTVATCGLCGCAQARALLGTAGARAARCTAARLDQAKPDLTLGGAEGQVPAEVPGRRKAKEKVKTEGACSGQQVLPRWTDLPFASHNLRMFLIGRSRCGGCRRPGAC